MPHMLDLGNVVGSTGPTGPTGPMGPTGPTGPQGATGSTPSLLSCWPVGSVYSSYTSTSPASRFGGTWTPITGRFPYYNSGNGTGGSNSHSHVYGIGGRDFYSLQTALQIYNGLNNSWITVDTKANTVNGDANSVATNSQKTLSMSWYHSTSNTTEVNNMPQYQTLYAWRRTA